MEKYCFEITEELEGERIDECLTLLMDSLSRSFVQKIIKEGGVAVNDAAVKGSYRVKAQDCISFLLPPAEEPNIEAENIPLDILYEDKDVIVVNKPKGMVVHPAAGHYSGTLVNALMYHCGSELSGINGCLRPGIVHRIDMDTTGSIIACKNDRAHNSIAEQLKEHTITRRYHAICYGILKEDGTVDRPIGRHPVERKKMAVNGQNGKYAVTHYHILGHLGNYTYLECRLETGRTHQIRVHMASIGHPLLGDALYAPDRKTPIPLQGQTLHAKILGFCHPSTREYIEVDAPLPEYFQRLLAILS